MKKRIFLTATSVVMLILFVTSLYITPASACRKKPEVEIWKKILDTSDPPPYSLKTEYQWDIEIGVWTSIDLKCARVYDRFGAELKIDHIRIDYDQDGTIDETYEFNYIDYEEKYPTWNAEVSINGGEPHRLNWRGVRFGDEPYKFCIRWTGKTHKIHFKWYIGKLEADETITIIVGVSTDLNPGGKQEYTSPCEHCINSGAVLKAKYKYRCRWRCISAESERLCIKVQCEEPLPAKLSIRKFKDIEDIGVFNEGIDELITDWDMTVTYPDGSTMTYPTPVDLEITVFGTYTITEDLPDGWEQTVVEVDGVPQPLAPTVTVEINEGESHSVLYGNREVPTPPPAKLVIEKFEDTNGNGVFDVGTESMITDWDMTVTYPDGSTMTYPTPVDLEITVFGTYTITEDLRPGWVQTAVEINGVPQDPITRTVTVEIDPGEDHHVLYGNAPPPPPIRIGMEIDPIDQAVGHNIAFSWQILTIHPLLEPQRIELTLQRPDGTTFLLHTTTNFPDDYAGTHVWTAELPTGTWWIWVTYYYEYLGTLRTAGTFGSFTVH